MNTRGERLQDAINRWHGGGVRAFQSQAQAELRRRGKRGGGYNKVFDYLKDRDEPSLDFLEVAAEILGVRVEWLRSEDGPRTQAEYVAEALETAWEDSGEEIERWKLIRDGLEAGFPALGKCGISVRSMALQLVLTELQRMQAVGVALDPRETGRRVGAALAAPFDSLGIRPPRHAVDTVLTLLASALTMLPYLTPAVEPVEQSANGSRRAPRKPKAEFAR